VAVTTLTSFLKEHRFTAARWVVLLTLVVFYVLLVSPHVFAQNSTPTATSLPACQTHHLTDNIGRVRSCAGENCGVIGGFTPTEAICVLGIAPEDSAWRIVQLGDDDTTEERTTGYMLAEVLIPGAPGTQPSESSYCDAWEVIIPQASVRSCAETTCGSLGTLEQGTRVCATGYSGSYTDWQSVEYPEPGSIGYVDSELMDFVNIDDFTCDTYQPLVEVMVYECASSGCASIGSLTPEDIVCSFGTESEDLEWLRIDYGQPGASGFILASSLAVVPEDVLLTVTPTIIPTAQARAVAVADINIRAEASTTATIVGFLGADESARILGVGEDGWFFVETDSGVTGWVSPTSVQTSGNLEGVPSMGGAGAGAEVTDESTSEVVAQASSPTATSQVSTVTPQIVATAESSLTATQGVTEAPSPTIPTETQITGQTALPACAYYQVNADSVNVRSEPTTQSEVIATLQRAAALCVRDVAVSLDSRQWFLVDLNANGSEPTLGYVAQDLVIAFQGATPTLVNSPAPTAVVTSSGIEATVTVPAEGTPIFCPTDLPTVTADASGQSASTTTAPLPVIVGCITTTPLPLLTAQPTQYASDVILARDIPLSTFVRQNIVLEAPQGLSQFTLRIPDDWEPSGNNVLYLNIEYFEDRSGMIGADVVPPSTTLDIRLDNNLVSSVTLNSDDVGVQTLQIALPANILANPLRRNHTVTIALDARDACRVRLESKVFVRVDQSFVHYEYREYLPVLDLARYPRPLFNNRRIVNEFESVFMVLPPEPSQADYEAAASIAAGLGLLTTGDLQVRTVTADALTDADREANHLILIGEVGTHPMIDDYYSRNLLPTTLNSSGQLSFRDTEVDQEHGVVQLLSNPENPRRAIFVVTGQSDLALRRAAQALAGQPSVLGLGGTLAIISDTQPLFHPIGNNSFEQPTTFNELGVTEDIILSGVGTQFTSIEFNVPFGGVVTSDAYVDIIYNYSQILAETSSTFTAEMNDVPIGSASLLPIDTGGATPTLMPSLFHLRVSVPPTSIITGATNTLTLQLDVPLAFGCEPPNPAASWFTISRDSTLFLPRSSFNPQTLIPYVGLFPVPMNSVPNLQDVWLSLPSEPTPQDLEQGMQMMSLLGAQTGQGEGFIPRVSLGELPEGTDLSRYHFIVIGRPTTNPFLADLNPNLPQPFLEGTDQIQQTLDDIEIILPEGFDIGILEMLVSPWSPSRLILVITGVTPSGQGYAANVLTSRSYDSSELAGDIVFAGANTITAIDSRSVGEVTEILETVIEQSTVDPIVPTVTPMIVVTVTNGPTLTPTETRTPGATIPPTGLYTNTPAPTIATEIPTHTPNPSGTPDYATEEPELPNSILGLMGVTAGVVVLVLLYGLFMWIRARQRAAKR
jgi:uncharacterized protein YgiM (DUF1202 family)